LEKDIQQHKSNHENPKNPGKQTKRNKNKTKRNKRNNHTNRNKQTSKQTNKQMSPSVMSLWQATKSLSGEAADAAAMPLMSPAAMPLKRLSR
jgi:hypothetical protein